jgi:hypothetical protein
MAERYNEGTDVKQNDDFKLARDWLGEGTGAHEPAFLADAVIWTDTVVNTGRAGARAKALVAAMNERGPRDFMTHVKVGHGPGRLATQLHHIFPMAYLRNHRVEDRAINRIFNLTFLTSETNGFMRDRAPSVYVSALIDRVAKESKSTRSQARKHVQDVFEEHFIDDEAFQAMMKDDFEPFIRARAAAFRARLQGRFGVTIRDAAPDEEPETEEEEEAAQAEVA